MTTNEQTKTPREQLRAMVDGAQVRDGRLVFAENGGTVAVVAFIRSRAVSVCLVCEAPDSGTIERMKKVADSHGLDITWPNWNHVTVRLRVGNAGD